MKLNDFLVIYEDGLQGKTHRLVVQAESVEAAWDKCLRIQAWQSPRIINVLPYTHAKRITN